VTQNQQSAKGQMSDYYIVFFSKVETEMQKNYDKFTNNTNHANIKNYLFIEEYNRNCN